MTNMALRFLCLAAGASWAAGSITLEYYTFGTDRTDHRRSRLFRKSKLSGHWLGFGNARGAYSVKGEVFHVGLGPRLECLGCERSAEAVISTNLPGGCLTGTHHCKENPNPLASKDMRVAAVAQYKPQKQFRESIRRPIQPKLKVINADSTEGAAVDDDGVVSMSDPLPSPITGAPALFEAVVFYNADDCKYSSPAARYIEIECKGNVAIHIRVTIKDVGNEPLALRRPLIPVLVSEEGASSDVRTPFASDAKTQGSGSRWVTLFDNSNFSVIKLIRVQNGENFIGGGIVASGSMAYGSPQLFLDAEFHFKQTPNRQRLGPYDATKGYLVATSDGRIVGDSLPSVPPTTSIFSRRNSSDGRQQVPFVAVHIVVQDRPSTAPGPVVEIPFKFMDG